MPRQLLWGVAAALALAGTAAAGHASEPPSLVVAVDTSRSLDASTLQRSAALASAALGELPEEVAVGVLAFDDAPRWVLASGTPAAAARALATLAPRGRYTLLDDALFTAARDAAPHSIVLLLTDGRDENSATTIEDVARACEARGVRVVPVATGRAVDERTLRRLALLTGGTYLGKLGAVTSRQLADAATAAPWTTSPPAISGGAPVASATAPAAPPAGGDPTAVDRTVTAALRLQSAAPTDGVAAAPAAATATSTAPQTSVGNRWWWLLLPLTIVAAALPLIVRTRDRRATATTTCRRCGETVPAGEDCPRCGAESAERALQERLRDRRAQRLEDTAELRLDVIAPPAPAEGDAIEKTRVLADHSALLVREPGVPERSYLLRPDGAFAIGRALKDNTVTLHDLALSAHHLKLVPEEGAFFIVDLESTNGTYLNRRRVRAARLRSGDLIHAGQAELEFRTFLGSMS